VTDAAILGSGQVVSGFAHGGYAIVAGGATAGDAGVVKHASGKTAYTMAHPAILGGRDVSGRLT